MNNICQVLLYEYKAAKRKGRSYFTAAFSTASETASNISCDVYGVSSDRDRVHQIALRFYIDNCLIFSQALAVIRVNTTLKC